MVSSSSVSMAMSLTSASQNKVPPSSDPFLKPLPVRPSKVVAPTSSKVKARLRVQASLKEKAIAGLTTAALSACIVIPEVAEAAGPGVSSSLKNYLLSIVAGGVVVGVLVGTVIAVSNFDPKENV